MSTLFVIILIIIILYLFLIAPRMLGRADRTPFLGYHYAHRGLFDNDSDAPENSLLAFQRAVDAGYGIELDVQLSKDNQLVIFHDASLKRMCGIDGNVWEYTLEELQKMKLADSEQTIPAFQDFLKITDGKVPFILEYKLDRPQTMVCELANAVLKDYSGAYCIESFHPLAVLWYRKHRPDVLRGQLSEEFFRESKNKGKHILTAASFLIFNFAGRPDFIAYNHLHANNISRKICKLLGALSVTYTIKSREEYERNQKNFDLFIFDNCRL